MKPKAYKLSDLRNCFANLGAYDTLEDALKAAEQLKEETNGECDLVILQWNDIYFAYKAILVMQSKVWEKVN